MPKGHNTDTRVGCGVSQRHTHDNNTHTPTPIGNHGNSVYTSQMRVAIVVVVKLHVIHTHTQVSLASKKMFEILCWHTQIPHKRATDVVSPSLPPAVRCSDINTPCTSSVVHRARALSQTCFDVIGAIETAHVHISTS